MKSYMALLDQLQRVEEEVEAARLAEYQRVVEEVRVTVAAYKIAEKDIFPSRSATGSNRRSGAAPKYWNPETGATWCGRGRRPLWLKAVADIDAYLIER